MNTDEILPGGVASDIGAMLLGTGAMRMGSPMARGKYRYYHAARPGQREQVIASGMNEPALVHKNRGIIRNHLWQAAERRDFSTKNVGDAIKELSKIRSLKDLNDKLRPLRLEIPANEVSRIERAKLPTAMSEHLSKGDPGMMRRLLSWGLLRKTRSIPEGIAPHEFRKNPGFKWLSGAGIKAKPFRALAGLGLIGGGGALTLGGASDLVSKALPDSVVEPTNFVPSSSTIRNVALGGLGLAGGAYGLHRYMNRDEEEEKKASLSNTQLLQLSLIKSADIKDTKVVKWLNGDGADDKWRWVAAGGLMAGLPIDLASRAYLKAVRPITSKDPDKEDKKLNKALKAQARELGVSVADDDSSQHNKAITERGLGNTLRRYLGMDPIKARVGTSYAPSLKEITLNKKMHTPGILAHEVGHVQGPNLLMTANILGQTGLGAGTILSLLSPDEVMGKRMALVATGLAGGGLLASEIDASRRGYSNIRDLGGSRGTALQSAIGLPTYLAAASVPLLAYYIKKRMGGYK